MCEVWLLIYHTQGIYQTPGNSLYRNTTSTSPRRLYLLLRPLRNLRRRIRVAIGVRIAHLGVTVPSAALVRRVIFLRDI